MAYVHIVIFKVKQQVIENGFEEFKARCETLRDVQVAKEEATELKFGPPVWDTRAHGFNYGLYTVFKTLEGLEKYKVDPQHIECVFSLTRFVRSVIVPNVDGAALLTRHPGLRLCALTILYSTNNSYSQASFVCRRVIAGSTRHAIIVDGAPAACCCMWMRP